MNEKFWDLKKVKQDRIINGALKIFAGNGYRHASTDEIASEAGISKGLLFHYFYSKIGLYAFLCEYSGRFTLLEINAALRRKDEMPYFALQRELVKAEAQVMRQYPYMPLFLKRASQEPMEEVREASAGTERLAADRCAELLEQAQRPQTLSAADAERVNSMMNLIRQETAAVLLAGNHFTPERFVGEVNPYIDMIEKMTRGES